MVSPRLRALPWALLLVVGGAATSTAPIADSSWATSLDGTAGARQGVARHRGTSDGATGLTVLCDERSPDYMILVDFADDVLFRTAWDERWSELFILADGELVHSDEERRSVRASGRPGSARRVLRQGEADTLLVALSAADDVEIVAMAAAYGRRPPRVSLDARGFDDALDAACPWTANVADASSR